MSKITEKGKITVALSIGMRKIKKLRAFYSKRQKSNVIEYPSGVHTRSDVHVLNEVFTKELRKELEDRGYDWTTFKFEISPKLPNDRFVD
jgi:hypothetical protein